MQKIPTLFERDESRRYVTDRVTPGCEWVLDGEGEPTRKYDGTCVMLDEDGLWWARREVKPGKEPPPGFEPVCADEVTGKTVGWEPIEQSGFAKYHAEALGNPYERRAMGTYELVGPKINGNPEGIQRHELVPHGSWIEPVPIPTTFEALRRFMAVYPHEGIVWHHLDGRMAKLKRRDFPSAPKENQ